MTVARRYAVPDDHTFATNAGVSLDAVQLLRDSEVVDLHVESFIPPRLFGYDLNREHGVGPTGGRLFGHLDFPRALEGGLTGAMWSISTNIVRGATGRWRVLQKNVEQLRAAIDGTKGDMVAVRDRAEYDAARAAGAHAAMLAIQGGNAYEGAPDGPASLRGGWITRVTLVHLSNSVYGVTSSPAKLFRRSRGLTRRGASLVEQLNAERIFVDLAHISEGGFWAALEQHDVSQPVIVTHTGVDGVRRHWRNLSDAQLRAVADTGGVVGVIFQKGFLRRRGGPNDGRMVVEHLKHILDVAGEDVAAVGSDYDGFIVPPKNLRDGRFGYARLLQHLLDAGMSDVVIRKVLGANFLRAFQELRPGPPGIPQGGGEAARDHPA